MQNTAFWLNWRNQHSREKATRDRTKVMVDRKTLSESGENFLHIVSDIDFRQLLGKTDTLVGWFHIISG